MFRCAELYVCVLNCCGLAENQIATADFKNIVCVLKSERCVASVYLARLVAWQEESVKSATRVLENVL